MKKVNGFVLSAIVGFVIGLILSAFVLWKINPASMDASERGVVVFVATMGALLGICFYGAYKSFID